MLSSDNGIEAGDSKKSLVIRIFGTRAYMRLFSAQFVTALGDWLGLIAISVTAAQIGAGSPETAVGLVLAVRLGPGFFLSHLAGVVADQIDRRKLMITCDIARAAVLLYLPFVDTVWQLVIVSFVLEIFTLLWIPAKEALLPDIVPKSRLSTANSLSLIATYGTFPLASVLLLLLSPLADVLDGVSALDIFRIDDTSIAFYVDSLTFLASAMFLVSMHSLLTAKPAHQAKSSSESGTKFGSEIGKTTIRYYLIRTFIELREGMKYVALNPVVRSVNIGIATALIGGGMLIPLGAVYSTDVLDAGATGYAAMQAALGSGAGLGVILLLVLRRYRKLEDSNIFVWSTLGAGLSLIVATALNVLVGVLIAVGLLGVFAGAIYVAGFTLLHDKVSEELRGRVFSSLYALMRFCVLLSLVVAPFLSTLIGQLAEYLLGEEIQFGDFTYQVSGIRFTLWLAAIFIILAGVFSSRGLENGNSKKENSPDALKPDALKPDSSEKGS